MSPARVGKRIPGGIQRHTEEYSRDVPYVVVNKPLKVDGKMLAVGTVVPAKVIESMPRIDTWVRFRRIAPAPPKAPAA